MAHVFRCSAVAVAIALSLVCTGASADPPVRVQRPIRAIPLPSVETAEHPVVILPPGALRQSGPAVPLPAASTGISLLTDAEKLAMVQHFPGRTASSAATSITSTVLTPMRPHLRNRASILHGGTFNGLKVNGESSTSYPPHWSLGGTGDDLALQFLPAPAGKLTFVVFYVAHLNSYRSYVINGYNADAVNGKVVFAVTPESTGLMWVNFRNAHVDQMTLVTSVEIFVAE